MSNSPKTVTVQLPYAGLLGIIFITLKLTGYIDWSWLWVLAPFWAPFAIAMVIVLIMAIFYIFKGK